jgi:hypothetical protein
MPLEQGESGRCGTAAAVWLGKPERWLSAIVALSL